MECEYFMEKIMYITGSFPRLGDGIGDAAGRLYDAIPYKDNLELVTLDASEISNYISEKNYSNVQLMPNWKIHSVIYILQKIKKDHIQNVLIEYAGNGYRKDLAISFLPLSIRILNIFSTQKIVCHLRLHEFTMCRPARKIFTYPLIWFCHHLDTPSFVEYKYLRKKYGGKVYKSAIGANINWRKEKKEYKPCKTHKIRLAFFGGIYPGKGIEKLLDIWGKLEEMYPNTYEYQLLGGFPKNLTNAFDDYQIKIQKLIASKNLSEKIFISGFLPEEEIEKWLDQVDIAVLPYEDGLTLRRGSFLAFLARQVAVVTSNGDAEARRLFEISEGVKMCESSNEMIQAITEYTIDENYYEAGTDNARFKKYFKWEKIAETILNCFID